MNILREVENIFDKHATYQGKGYITNDILKLKIEVARLVNKVKGDPVPSLDKEEIRIIINSLEEYKELPCGTYPSNDKINNIISKLQNGVETDNEYPKLGLFEPSRIDMKNVKTFDIIREEDDYLG